MNALLSKERIASDNQGRSEVGVKQVVLGVLQVIRKRARLGAQLVIHRSTGKIRAMVNDSVVWGIIVNLVLELGSVLEIDQICNLLVARIVDVSRGPLG